MKGAIMSSFKAKCKAGVREIVSVSAAPPGWFAVFRRKGGQDGTEEIRFPICAWAAFNKYGQADDGLPFINNDVEPMVYLDDFGDVVSALSGANGVGLEFIRVDFG
jgi:hypothetical protein